MFDLQGQPAPKPEADGRVQLPKETKISLVMVTSPEGKRYYLGFSDWDAVHEWQKAQPKAAQQIILLRFDDYANMIAKNAEASGLVINPGDNSLRLERPLIESVKKTKDEVSQKIAAQLAEQQARRIHPGDKVTLVGFGTFEVRERPERKGRNPQTGAEITIEASKLPAFKAGKALKDAVQ